MKSKFISFLEHHKHYGALFLRLAFGFQLINGTIDNVVSYDRMIEFKEFLEVRNVHFPLIAAHLSVYAQFLSGILLIIGLWVRYISIIIIINFIAALIIAHIGLPYESNFPAINLLAAGFFFLFYGAGAASIDALINSRRRNRGLIL